MLSTLRRSTAPLRRSTAPLGASRAEALSSLASMTPGGGVHGSQTSVNARRWRQKPLLRVYGEELYFKTGSDAVKLLSNEAERRDKDKPLYLDQFTNFMRHLQPVRSRRPVVWRCLHFIQTTRVHLTMKWVVSFSSSRPFGPSMLRAGL